MPQFSFICTVPVLFFLWYADILLWFTYNRYFIFIVAILRLNEWCVWFTSKWIRSVFTLNISFLFQTLSTSFLRPIRTLSDAYFSTSPVQCAVIYLYFCDLIRIQVMLLLKSTFELTV